MTNLASATAGRLAGGLGSGGGELGGKGGDKVTIGACKPIKQATRPETRAPKKEKSLLGCPLCRSKNSIRILTFAKVRRYMCTRCDVQYNESGIIPEMAEKKPGTPPKYEQRYTAGARLNKRWIVSKAERVVSRFKELVSQEINPLEAIILIGQEINRDVDEVLLLIVDLAGTEWVIRPEEPKKVPPKVREIMFETYPEVM